MTYSFDIFDTCLCRSCGEPINVFTLLAIKVLGCTASNAQIADFRYIRIQGEQQARKNYIEKEDISINDIYLHCNFSSLTNMPITKIIEYELITESSLLSPIKKTLEIIKNIHSKEDNIIFISDMYLPSNFLKQKLDEHSFWKNGDKIYVSGEIGKTKSTGALFKYISNVEKLKFGKWKHYGDNFFSDYISPRKLGIHSIYLKQQSSFYQRQYIKDDFDPIYKKLSIYSGLSKSICNEYGFDSYTMFAADIIAPLYVPFVYRVLNKAFTEGINKLFFLSRDGYIFYEIAKIFSNQFPSIKLSYLYVSRKSLYFPAMDEIDMATLIKQLSNHSKEEIINLLDYYHINPSEFIDINQSKEEIVKSLSLNKEIILTINNNRLNQKNISIKYFIQEGLADNDAKSAIVDLRGTRKCQTSINKLLFNFNFKPVFAFYYEVSYNRIFPLRKDEYDACIFGDFIRNNIKFKNFDETFLLLEHYFSITPFRRTSSYVIKGKSIDPQFDETEIVFSNAKEISDLNIRICKTFAQKCLNLGLLDSPDLIIQYATYIISKFVELPRREYLKALINIDTSETQRHPTVLIKYLKPKDLIIRKITWVDASVMLTFGKLTYWVYKFIFRKCQRIIRNLF